MLGRLTVADNSSPWIPRQDGIKLRRKGLSLVRYAKRMTRITEQLLRDLNTGGCLDGNLAILDALSENANAITEIVTSMGDRKEDLVMARISSLGQQNSEVKKLLLHFKEELRITVRDVLSSTGSTEPKFLKILEECYKRAVNNTGRLSCDRYLEYIGEASLASPYDPDYESEQFYEHEDRLQIDENYAACFEAERERKYADRMEAREYTKRIWIEFWSQALQKCPGGPTLFIPTDTLGANDFPHTSGYLFRAFDLASSGRTDDTVVASAASVYSDLEVDHVNILSLSQQEASERLGKHLWNQRFDASNFTNLVSWSNSLLFVIQYAIYMCAKSSWNPSDVQICALDTDKFPPGQFARDLWLVQRCHDPSQSDSSLGDLIQLRKIRGYYNGEHLSQGDVTHKGRSCIVSLQQLIDAGLCKLYPEFDDLEGRKEWTKRVRALRSKWSFTSSTTQEDIRLAVQLANLCFPGMPPLDLALIFLTFKNRKARGKFRMRISKFGSHGFYIHCMSLKYLYRYSIAAGYVRYPGTRGRADV